MKALRRPRREHDNEWPSGHRSVLEGPRSINPRRVSVRRDLRWRGVVFTLNPNMRGGRVDSLVKPFDNRELVSVIRRTVGQGARRRAVRQEAVAATRRARLTKRERDVMELAVAGKENKQIAAELGVSSKTIEVHRARVMAKMEARSLAELVRNALSIQADVTW